MKKEGKKSLIIGGALIGVFALWTALILLVDVQNVGVNGTKIGLASLNTWFHGLTGTNMALYTITDWLGLVPIFVCFFFGIVGLIRLIKRKSLLKVDFDIILLGIYYIMVIAEYLVFEMLPINYRPILINGLMETSYPSSTTLLVLSVMPTLIFQASFRLKSSVARRIITISTVIFSVFMVVGRLISGVHWISDIIGSVLISAGMFYVYKGIVLWNLAKNYRN